MMTELEASERATSGEAPPPYMIFVVVFLFFLTGLLGFLICHLLKKKGYRCRTGDVDDEEEEEKLGVNADDAEEDNQDTVEQILKCIIENEANMEAFNEMLGNRNVCVRHDPRLRKESIGGIPPHLHTVHSGTDHNTCHLCAQIKSKKGRRPSRTPRFKQRPGEQTVFSVGRFRVTHTDKKQQVPNPLVASGDHLDHSQDSEERKEGGSNLRNLFKDVRPPSESSSGVAPTVGKRRRSLTIFGLRRGSDPVGLRGVEGAGRDTAGVKFGIQQQPVVLEEPLQPENGESGTEPGSRPETVPVKNQTPASLQNEAKTTDSVDASTLKTNKPVNGISSVAEQAPKLESSPEPNTSIMTKPIVESTVMSTPSSLPISVNSSAITRVKETDKVLKIEDDTAPLQTSTPISPTPGSNTGFTPAPFTQPDSDSRNIIPVTQAPPDPCSSPDLEPSFSASPALISLGSSPPSFPHKALSSTSSLKTPTSPLAITASPNSSSRSVPLEATKPARALSPQLATVQAIYSDPPSPSLDKSTTSLQVQAPSPAMSAGPQLDTMLVSPQTSSGMSVALTRADMVSSLISLRDSEPEGATIPKSDEKTDLRTAGILQPPADSPYDSKGSVLPSLSKDRWSSLPLSPRSPVSPSSVSGVTIIRANPDSKREFSVVTMLEEEAPSPAHTSELQDESGKAPSTSTSQEGEVSVSGVRQTERQKDEMSGAETELSVSQDKDDMMEMEDIRDCKVKVEEDTESKRD